MMFPDLVASVSKEFYLQRAGETPCDDVYQNFAMEPLAAASMGVIGVEEAGVLARGADRLAVEKLARYFL